MVPPGRPLVLEHRRTEMQTLSDWISHWLEASGTTGPLAYAVRLCLEEAVLNIMVHGVPQPGLAPEITVVLHRTQTGVTAAIADHGPPFDPLSYVPPPRNTIPVGGFGIPLMRHYSRTMSYRRENGANHLAMTFTQDARH